MARSFAQLARSAEKSSSSIAVPKEPLESAPLNIYTLGDDALRGDARRIGKVDERVLDLARDMLRSMPNGADDGLPGLGMPCRSGEQPP